MFIYWKGDGDYIRVESVNRADGGTDTIMTRRAFDEFKLWAKRIGFDFVLKV